MFHAFFTKIKFRFWGAKCVCLSLFVILIWVILGQKLYFVDRKIEWKGFRVGAETPLEPLAQDRRDYVWVRVKMRLTKKPAISGSKYIIEQNSWRVTLATDVVVNRGDRLVLVGNMYKRVTGLGKEYFYLNYPEIVSIEKEEAAKSVKERILWRVEDWQQKIIPLMTRGLPEPQGSLLIGMLLGIKAQMPEEFYESLVDTGTVHMIAASGYNISVVAGALVAMFSRLFKKKMAIVLSFIGIIIYTLLAGASAAVVRAAVMGCLAYLAKLAGRDYWASWGLILAAGGMLVFEPDLIEDVGFWLSVTATGGILWLAPDINRGFKRFIEKLKFKEKSKTKEVLDLTTLELATTLAAQLVTMPVIIGVFGRVSVVSPLANLMVIWLIPGIMALGLVKMMAEAISTVLGGVVGSVVYVPLTIFVILVKKMGGFNWSATELDWFDMNKIDWIDLVWVYLGLIMAYLWFKKTLLRVIKGKRKTEIIMVDRV